jgi:hypothetical protein
MENKQTPRRDHRQNGHATIGRKPAVSPGPAEPDSAEMEPKGVPTSDRYRAETVHADETDDHTRIAKTPHQK